MGNLNPIMNKYQEKPGRPWSLSGKESTARAGDEFGPWSRRPHMVMKQLNPCVPTAEPVCALEPGGVTPESPRAAMTEAHVA